ncbi:type II toxin-antitoxin system VapC family toxin [Thermococcus pacificus]|uniref:Ribonuclease VapC n=1 Tax=Thermococcus pacificus TaxID=71998 RepID=A0A218P8C9_9EURY|nr:type II toxin-antitoxin system VapC family toxin [Thermococcus pacificus]ASJ06990.1 nucleotide-binding protein [Thermococcus pacificus]
MKGVLLDTSILIEHFKGNLKARNVLLSLMDSDVVLFINPIVFSEVVYLLLGFYSGVSPRSLKGKPEKLPGELDLVFESLEEYAFVELGEKTSRIARDLIRKYAMLPNDALILATCIEHGFSLATLDEDFKAPAGKEGVPIITG